MILTKTITRGLFLFFLFVASSFVITSCGDNSKTVNKDGIEYTSNYICPMHCKGSGDKVAGKCPTCKMDYVWNESKGPKPATGHEGHDHSGHSHHGHDHSGHSH